MICCVCRGGMRVRCCTGTCPTTVGKSEIVQQRFHKHLSHDHNGQQHDSGRWCKMSFFHGHSQWGDPFMFNEDSFKKSRPTIRTDPNSFNLNGFVPPFASVIVFVCDVIIPQLEVQSVAVTSAHVQFIGNGQPLQIQFNAVVV